MDKVVDEIRKNNVVQIMTDNERAFKVERKMMMTMREHLYWTPCAAHSIQ